MFDSDESHALAWLEWAAATPGGWQARLADKDAAGHSAPDHVPSEWTLDSPPASAGTGAELVRYVQAQSPCCGASVVVDPLVPGGSRGMCSTCGTVLDHAGPGWLPRPPGTGVA